LASEARLSYQYRLQREEQEAERKRIEANGVREYNRLVGPLHADVLRSRGIDATLELARSENAKVVVLGGGGTGGRQCCSTSATACPANGRPISPSRRSLVPLTRSIGRGWANVHMQQSREKLQAGGSSIDDDFGFRLQSKQQHPPVVDTRRDLGERAVVVDQEPRIARHPALPGRQALAVGHRVEPGPHAARVAEPLAAAPDVRGELVGVERLGVGVRPSVVLDVDAGRWNDDIVEAEQPADLGDQLLPPALSGDAREPPLDQCAESLFVGGRCRSSSITRRADRGAPTWPPIASVPLDRADRERNSDRIMQWS